MHIETAYIITRAALGINILLHGAVRLPGRKKFAEVLKIEFLGTVLPKPLVELFASALPFIEFVIGFLLLAGFFTQLSIIAGSVIMLMLLTGKSLKQDWATVTFQMIYILFYAALEAALQYNKFSLDYLFNL